MPPPVEPSTLAAVAPSGGNLLGTLISSAFNAWQAGKNRGFQREMSNTAYQREMRDMRLAGLNPMLSAKHGGASTPPGSAAQASQSTLGHDIAAGMQLKLQSELQKAQIDDMTSAAQLKRAQAGDITYGQQERVQLMLAQARQALASGELSENQKRKVEHEINLLQQQLNLLRVQTKAAQYDLSRKKFQSKVFEAPFSAFDEFKKHLQKKKEERPKIDWEPVKKKMRRIKDVIIRRR